MMILSNYPNRIKSDQDEFLKFCSKVLNQSELNSSEKLMLIDSRLEKTKKEIEKVTRIYSLFL